MKRHPGRLAEPGRLATSPWQDPELRGLPAFLVRVELRQDAPAVPSRLLPLRPYPPLRPLPEQPVSGSACGPIQRDRGQESSNASSSR